MMPAMDIPDIDRLEHWHFELTETQQVIADRAGFVAIGLAVALFIVICYFQFFG